jgi:hypothetical protein
MSTAFSTPEERKALIAEMEAAMDDDGDQSVDDSTDEEEVVEAKDPKAPKAPKDGLKEEHRKEYDPTSKIPPMRWNQVLDERNTLRQRIALLEKSASEPRQSPAKVNGGPQSQADPIDQEINRILGRDPDVPDNDPTAQRIANLERQIERLARSSESFEVRDEKAKLQAEATEVLKRYPHMDPSVLFTVVAKAEHPEQVDLMEVAERYEELLEKEFEKRAKAKGLTGKAAQADVKQQMRTQAEAPRPRPTGSGPESDATKESFDMSDPKQRRAYAKAQMANAR